MDPTTNNGSGSEPSTPIEDRLGSIDKLDAETIQYVQAIRNIRKDADRYREAYESLQVELAVANTRIANLEQDMRKVSFQRDRYIRAVVAMNTRAQMLVDTGLSLQQEGRDAARMAGEIDIEPARLTNEEIRDTERIARAHSPRIDQQGYEDQGK